MVCRDKNGGLRGTTIKSVNWTLQQVSRSRILTLSITFSSELGQSIAKQTKRRSVSGYERGRKRSYSSCPAVSQSASSTAFPLGRWVG
jgi:hypothetical protein